MPAPAPTAARITSGLEVSMDNGNVVAAARRSISGTTRRISPSTDTSPAPGRVDSPPMSSMSAPSSASVMACAYAASSVSCRPPSENESGVTLTMPTTRGRSRLRARPLQSRTVAKGSIFMGSDRLLAAERTHETAVVAQLFDGVADVGQRRVRRVLVEAATDFRGPATREFLQRRHVQVAVVEVALQLGHLAMQEAAVLADGVAAHGRLAGGYPLAQERDGRFLGLLGRRVRFHRTTPQPRTHVLVAVPGIHLLQARIGMRYGEDRSLGKHVQILVRHDRGDFQDGIVIRIQTGHLQVDPDEVVFVRLRHGCSLGLR